MPLQPIPGRNSFDGMRKSGLIWALLAIGLWSCEGNTHQAYFLLNGTADDVVVVHSHSAYLPSPLDTVLVAAGELKALGTEDWLGGRVNPDLPAAFIDTFVVYNAAGVLCTKDWTLMDSWSIESFEDRKIPSQWRHEYTFEVGPTDF
jgi:hypothetical protein